MDIEPKSLNIPLHRNERWGYLLLAVCAGASVAAWLFNPGFALVFTTSCAVVLPSLWLFFFPPQFLKNRLPLFATYALLFGYLALAKVVVIPFFVRLFHASTAA